jgi:flagellar hook-associated protein 3 FlgL
MLARAYTMVADLGTADLNAEAYETLIDSAIRTVGGAIESLTAMQARLGSAQQRVANASERMSIQRQVIATHIDTLEGVDPYEATTRVSNLLTQIETAYALTARIQQLSLVDYI